MKKCVCCKIYKDLKEFHKNKLKRDGLHYYCKACCKNLSKIIYEKDKEKIKITKRKYYQENKEKSKEYQRNYQKKPETRERRAKNVRKRMQTDLNFKIRKNLRIRAIRAIERGTKGGSAISDLGCSIEEFKAYIESLWQPGMSWDNWGTGYVKWQLDHKDPLCLFDLTDRGQFLKACHYTNLQPLWYEDHVKKGEEDRLKKKNLDILKKPC